MRLVPKDSLLYLIQGRKDMNAVRVMVETPGLTAEYLVHVVNRSKHALSGALRNARRRYPNASSIEAEFLNIQRLPEPRRTS